MTESPKPSGPMTASEKARKFYEDHATNIVNVPRVGHPEDKSGWDGVERAVEAQVVAGDCLVMTLAEAIDFAAKFAASELQTPTSCPTCGSESPAMRWCMVREHGLSVHPYIRFECRQCTDDVFHAAHIPKPSESREPSKEGMEAGREVIDVWFNSDNPTWGLGVKEFAVIVDKHHAELRAELQRAKVFEHKYLHTRQSDLEAALEAQRKVMEEMYRALTAMEALARAIDPSKYESLLPGYGGRTFGEWRFSSTSALADYEELKKGKSQ